MTAATLKEELDRVGVEAFTARDYKPGRVVHIVLFAFRDDLSPAHLREAADRFLALADAPRDDGSPYILSIEAGTQHSGEDVGRGFDWAFVATFASEGDRNYYIGEPVHSDPRHFDPAHAAFKEFIGPLLKPEGVLVFDFTPGRR
jgi:hypothetical protein